MNFRRAVLHRGIVCGGMLAVALLFFPGQAAQAQNTHTLPLVPEASNAAFHGFVRIINRSNEAGTVRIHAIDDTGTRFGPVSLALDAQQTVNFSSGHLERGNASRGLSAGVGDGEGHWRLELDTDLTIVPLAYVRTADGFVTSMHDVVPEESTCHYVTFFNPGSNQRQRSWLRLINPGDGEAEVTIIARDDAGESAPEGEVSLRLPAGAARTLTAQALESGGSGLSGRAGDGTGKWQLFVSSDPSIQVMSLLTSPTGHLTNLSASPSETLMPADCERSTGADLVVQSPSVSDSSLSTGQAFTLSATVRNVGGERSPVTTLRYYRSSDETISTTDTPAGTDAVRGLDPSATSPESISLTAPSSAGTYYYGACVDTVTGESNTGNNCSSGVRVTVTLSPPPASCGVGHVLSAGEICRYEGGGSSFTISVRADGSQVCWGGSICAGRNLRINGFVVEKRSSGRWEIVALPTGVMPVVVPSPTGCPDEAAFSAFVLGKRIRTAYGEVRFTAGNRITETYSSGESYSGSYTYRKTGPNTATMRTSYDDGDRCTASLTCTSPTGGTLRFTCTGGESGSTPWRIIP